MSITVEDGSVVSGANSYNSLADFQDYCDARNRDYSSYSDEQQEAALVTAAQWLDSMPWKGVKTGRDNPMAWPRYGTETPGNLWNQLEWPASQWVGVLDRDGFYVPTDEVPREVTEAQNEAAWLILQGKTVEPALDRGGMVRREKFDVVEFEYFSGAPGEATFKPVTNRLVGLLKSSATMDIVRT